MDIRAQRTLKMLVDAFEELCCEKSLEEITVTELCNLSTVRRATFYRHFGDMRDFTKYYFATMTERLIARLSGLHDLDRLMPYAEAMHRELLEYVAENRMLARHAMGPGMLADTMDMIVVQIADGIVLRIHSEQDAGTVDASISAEAVGLFYSAGIAHSMRWWLLDDKPAPIGEIVDSGMAVLRRMLGMRD